MKRIRWFLLVFCLIVKILAFNHSQFISEINNKCQEIEEIVDGWEINRQAQDRRAEFVMFYTKEIEKHAIQAFCINKIYGKLHGIGMNLIDPSQITKDFEFGDVRWNKVKILYDLLLKKDKNISYYIWLDADLIISDFKFDFAAVYSQHSDFDILISKEINPANGIANTGSMVVKNNDWSLEFFRKWWNDYEHTSAMDQHTFEDLYRKISDNDEHILLLPENAINSIFPGLWTFRNNDPILHLAGESNFIREEIFQLALAEVQQHISTGHLPIQIVSRSVLDSIDYLGIHLKEWNQIISDINQILAMTPQYQIVELSEIHQMRYRIREAQQSFNKFSKDYILEIQQQRENSFLSDEILQQSIIALRLVYGLSCRVLLAIHRTPEKALPSILIPYYQSTIDTGFELLVVENSAENFLLLLRELEQLITRLKPFIHPNDQKILIYYSFKLAQFEGFYYENPSRMLSKPPDSGNQGENEQRTIESYSKAFNLWFQLANEFNYFGSGNSLLSSYEEGVKLLKKLLFLQCWQYERQDNNEKEKGNHYLSLAYNATCLLFHLVKESSLYLPDGQRDLHRCQSSAPHDDISFPSLLTISKRLEFPFEMISNYSQSEFIEIFMLFANCYDAEEIQEISAFNEWKQTFFPSFTLSMNSLQDYYSYFDIVTPSMMKYLLPSVDNYFASSASSRIIKSSPLSSSSPPKESKDGKEQTEINFSVSAGKDTSDGLTSNLTTKRLKKVKKRHSST